MNRLEILMQMLTNMNQFILEGKTGNPTEFAKKLNCEVPTFYLYIRYMRQKLATKNIFLVYDRTEKTYRYSQNGHFTIGWNWVSYTK
ncbi:MAG: hypothetical protein WCQ95_09245 [Bacteroidota bacterium]